MMFAMQLRGLCLCSLLVALLTAAPFAYAKDIEVTAGDITNHADPMIDGSIQAALNRAAGGDIVLLTEDAPYYIRSRLDIPSGVRLHGQRENMMHQRITVDGSFPPDTAMIRMRGGTPTANTTLQSLWVDGAHEVWRIVDMAPKGRHFTIHASKLEKTRNQFDTPDGGEFRSPISGQPYYPLHIIEAEQVSNVDISNNFLHFAGVSETGKVNGSQWMGVAYAVAASQSKELRIAENDIQFTLTGGIELTASIKAQVLDNVMKWVARNIEWTDADNDFLPPVTAGIYGSHNQKLLLEHVGTSMKPLHWAIKGNNISNSGQHGIHVGGHSIDVRNNTVANSAQVGVYAGDWRFDSYLPECTENVYVLDNIVSASGEYSDMQTLWNKPTSLPEWDKTTFGVDIRIDHHYGNSVRADYNQAQPVYWENSPERPWAFCGDKYEGLKPLDDIFIIRRNQTVPDLGKELMKNDIIQDASKLQITHINDQQLQPGIAIELPHGRVLLPEGSDKIQLQLNVDYTGKFEFTYSIASGSDVGAAKVYVKVE